MKKGMGQSRSRSAKKSSGGSGMKGGKINKNSASYKNSVKWGKKVLALANAYRKRKGRHPATQVWSTKLHDLCYKHSIDMAKAGRLSHDGFGHRVNLMRKMGVKVWGANENVAYNWGGSNPAKKVLGQWIKSPGHNRNLLANGRNVQSVSVFVSGGKWWFCQMFLKTK
jgi:uncharacterized protein YkwD